MYMKNANTLDVGTIVLIFFTNHMSMNCIFGKAYQKLYRYGNAINMLLHSYNIHADNLPRHDENV